MSLNELIQQIVTKKNQPASRLTLTFKTLSKPKYINHTHSFVSAEENELFYTFNGRALFFSKEQKEPIISMPEETKSAVYLHHNQNFYCFLLNSKNKLEVMEYSDIVSGPRFTVTRNVLQVQKTQNKVFFLFKKDVLYFIDECIFDGKRWFGKITCHNITGKEVLLFATDGVFYYTADTRVHNNEGKFLGFTADYVHRYEKILVIGTKKENSYELKLLDIENNYQEVFDYTIESNAISKIVSHSDIVVLKSTKDLYIFRIDPFSKKFTVSFEFSYFQEIYNFDFYFNSAKESFIFYLLADSKYSDMTQVISDQNEASLITQNSEQLDSSFSSNFEERDYDSLPSTDDITTGLNSGKNNSDSISKEDGFFYETSSNRKSSILKEMESMSLTPQPAEKFTSLIPKNNLLEEVRATLNKKKVVSKSESEIEKEENSPVVDRFESYRAEIEKSSPAQSPIKSKAIKKSVESSTIFSSPETKNKKTIPTPNVVELDIERPISNVESSENFNNSPIPTHPVVASTVKSPFKSKGTNNEESVIPQLSPNIDKETLEGYLNEFKKMTVESHKKTIKAVESMIIERDSNDMAIKESAIKLLVPVVEACFNEMRIQIITEIKKLTSAALETSEKKSHSISKLLAAGKTTQAIEEFLKLDENEMAIHVPAFNSSALEIADSNSIFLLLSKIYELVKKSPKDSYFKLIYFCLIELEINDLSIDQLQDLCIIIRYIKEMNGFDEDKYSELCCILDITAKKIRKRVKLSNGK